MGSPILRRGKLLATTVARGLWHGSESVRLRVIEAERSGEGRGKRGKDFSTFSLSSHHHLPCRQDPLPPTHMVKTRKAAAQSLTDEEVESEEDQRPRKPAAKAKKVAAKAKAKAVVRQSDGRPSSGQWHCRQLTLSPL